MYKHENLNNPAVPWEPDWIEEKWWCSCGFKYDVSFREIYIYGRERLWDAHKKWADEIRIREGICYFPIK